MTPSEFSHFRARFHDECTKILDSKGADYSSTTDRLDNFKKLATQLGQDPLTVWAIYFTKHIDAIMTYVRTGVANSEKIDGRFADARNYLDLGLALLSEQRASAKRGVENATPTPAVREPFSKG